MLKIYYRLELLQTSPLHLSNGNDESTDSDLMKDSRGLPFIPGSGLAGAMRALLPEKEGDALFGSIHDGSLKASRVLVSDAVLPSDTQDSDIHLAYRDGVGLDLVRGTALKTAKYDFEAVETALPYTTLLEWTGEADDKTAETLQTLVAGLVADGLQLGGKTSRGYGAMQVSAKKKVYSFPKDLTEWLAGLPEESGEGWVPVEGASRTGMFREYRLAFRVQGAVSVRVYSSDVNQADFAPMKNSLGQPVIPGTSWAGSFRHRMHALARELGCSEEEETSIDFLFGKLPGGMQRSFISFSQSDLRGGKQYELTRNALDRFTSAPAMSALFTAGYWHGGEGNLIIRIDADKEGQKAFTPLMEQLLLAAIRDLDMGLMTVGGGASVGLGRLQITEMLADGRPVSLQAEVKEG